MAEDLSVWMTTSEGIKVSDNKITVLNRVNFLILRGFRIWGFFGGDYETKPYEVSSYYMHDPAYIWSLWIIEHLP